jgi:hypothetical protein
MLLSRKRAGSENISSNFSGAPGIFIKKYVRDRMEILRSFFKESDFGLGIEPSYNPVTPKYQGYNVETIDYIYAGDLK